MTDEQFETYNKLLNLVDELIEKISDEQTKKDYKEKKNDILLKK